MGYIITFAQQKGGAGKTTVLAHLAAEWVTADRSVAVADLDAQGSLTRWATLRDDPRITNIDTRDYRAGSDLRAAARSHDYVLVDCPGAASGLLESALRESDLVVAPCQPSAMDVWATETILDAAARLKVPTAILFNRMPPRMSDLDDIIQALGGARERLLAARLGNRVAYSKAFHSGRSASEVSPRSKAASEVSVLRSEIEDILAA